MERLQLGVAHERSQVLIPLNSGLAWSQRAVRICSAVHGLNPFEFRAGLEPDTIPEYLKELCLNPFEFRAGLERLRGYK